MAHSNFNRQEFKFETDSFEFGHDDAHEAKLSIYDDKN